MTKDEALKLALEALETLHDENMDYLTRNKLGGENNQCMVFAREAITAIKEALAQPEQDYERGFIDGMHKQMQSSVDKAVNRLAQRTWVGLTDEEIDQGLVRTNYAMQTAGAWRDGVEWAVKQLQERNT